MGNLEVSHALFVLPSATRRGAELEGLALAHALADSKGMTARAVALAPARDGVEPIAVDVLGTSARSPSTLWNLRRLAGAADVVVAFGSTALPACAVALAGTRTPFLYRSIGDPAQWSRGPAHRFRTGCLMRRSAHVVALWEAARSSLVDLYGIDRRRTSILPNARPTDRFVVPSERQRVAGRHALGVAEDVPLVLYLGALTEEKRVDRAIEAIGLLPDVRLFVAGDGPLRAELESLAARAAGDRIRFVGLVSDATPLLAAADAVVLTSRTEGMPGAVIEALLCGVPVVAPAVGALPEMIDDGHTGRLTGAGDIELTARALLEVTDPAFPHGIALRSAAVGRFDLDTVATRWASLLEDVARRPE